MKKALIFMGMGIEIGFLVFGAYFLGEALDKVYATDGLIFVVLAFSVLILWLIQVIWLVRKLETSGSDE